MFYSEVNKLIGASSVFCVLNVIFSCGVCVGKIP